MTTRRIQQIIQTMIALLSQIQRRAGLLACLLAGLALFWSPSPVCAQQEQQGVCTMIKMVISQQLTLERVGFLATLTITDNDATDPITDFAANLTFENQALSTNGLVNDSSSLFFVQPPTLQSIQGVAGDGSIGSGQTATISWFIIPTTVAGGMVPTGTRYQVGAILSGKLRGVQIPAATMSVIAAPITVFPDAQLQITYFQPRDVLGDNPFTPQVESPVPFTFGVLVQNVGYGAAHNVAINSQQPKITQNRQSAIIVAQLLGSRVNDSALANANLTVNLGDLQPGQATKGAWDMIVSLSGTFLSVDATYTHAPALGGTETSLIKAVKAYLFLHEVLDDTPGRDNVRDFLADTSGNLDPIGNLMPDSLYESDGNVFPVIAVTNALTTALGNSLQINLGATNLGWTLVRVDDPQQSKLPILSVVRSDGKALNTNNFWTNIHYEPGNNFEHFYLNVFDRVSSGPYTYVVNYGTPTVSTNPPATTLLFAGSSTLANGVFYVTPDTQMYFVSQDVTPVSVFYSLDGGAFQPALPFSLSTPGVHQLVYYATNSSGIQETNHTAMLALSGLASLGFANFNVPAQPIYPAGDAMSIRPASLPISFQAIAAPVVVNAQVDIFPGVIGWPALAGIPSSPTASTTASLTVSGQNVDQYIYSLNGQPWSAEQPVASPLNLSNLPMGVDSVSILGRSQFGAYSDPSRALSVSWVIDSNAPPTQITGTPVSPSRSDSAQFAIGGSGVTHYRWTVDNGYYRAESTVNAGIVLSNLTAGAHVLSVLGKANGIYQGTNNPTTVTWISDPLYGYDESPLAPVRSVAYTNIGAKTITLNWDGRSDAGIVQPPGTYTVRVRLSDSLGETNFVVGLAHISALAGTNVVVADATRGSKNPYARGRWAVWQDQSSGNWAVYAQDLMAANNAIIPVSNSPLSQENPRTDGRYVVWQARQPGGNWDIYINDLAGTNGPQALTRSSKVDKINPTIDWPWVVYQARSNATNNGPWQLYALNLVTSQTSRLSSSTQDELNPDVQAGRVVWQDWRDVGPGEIYFQNLETGEARRITTNTFGQYSPVIYDNWIVWQDNRNTQSDLYGFDLLRNVEVRLTSTPEDEIQPRLNGSWLVCMENSLGAATGNARLIHLPSLASVPVSHTPTLKSQATLAEGRVIWLETVTNQSQVVVSELPALQPVFADRNTVAVTGTMVTYAQNAYGLLGLWAASGVQSITSYGQLVPVVVSHTATIANGVPSGENFDLVAGSSLWVKFNTGRVLDLGINNAAPLDLAAGANVFGYSHFPDAYSAFQLLRQLGLNNARAVRMLDSQSGLWQVAEVLDGVAVGNDFAIPTVAVLMIDVAQPVSQFTPQSH